MTSPDQRLRIGGGAYGITCTFWDPHAGDFDRVVIVDFERGDLIADAEAIARATRQTLHAGYGEQMIIWGKYLAVPAAPGELGEHAQAQHAPALEDTRGREPEQMQMFDLHRRAA